MTATARTRTEKAEGLVLVAILLLVAGFAGASTSFANGVGTWAPTGTPGEAKTYQFIWTLDPNTPNTAQSGTAAIGFTWEAQNS